MCLKGVIWFGIMTRKTLRGASFASTEELATAVNDFSAAYNDKATPFVWRNREVKGFQLRNTIVNLPKQTPTALAYRSGLPTACPRPDGAG